MRLSTRDYITKRLSESERYAQLAEECNELGKAALKIRRIITPGASPTLMTIEAALDNLHEEFADVLVCCDVLPLDWAKIHDIERKKSERWVKRLMERKEREDEKSGSVQRESDSLQ